MPKKKRPKPEPKHPRDMTTEEAIEHLFHPEIVKKAREHIAESGERPIKDH